jgi:hypothetical protein
MNGVTAPTHTLGDLLDVVVTRQDLPHPDVVVRDVGLSDHHMLRWTVPVSRLAPVYSSVVRRPWRRWKWLPFVRLCRRQHSAALIGGRTSASTTSLGCTIPRSLWCLIDLFQFRPSSFVVARRILGSTSNVELPSAVCDVWRGLLAPPAETTLHPLQPLQLLPGPLSVESTVTFFVRRERRFGMRRLMPSVQLRGSCGDLLMHFSVAAALRQRKTSALKSSIAILRTRSSMFVLRLMVPHRQNSPR